MLDKVTFEGNKRVKDSELTPVDRIQAARQPATLRRTGRRRPHHRGLQACRPRRRQRETRDHRPRQRSRRSRLRSDRGREDPVRQINFIGNTVFGKRQLAAVIKTSANNMLSFLTGGDVYDPDMVNADRELLRNTIAAKAMPTRACPRSMPNTIPRKGIHAHLRHRRGAALSFRRYRIDCHVDGVDPRKTSPPAAGRDRARCSTARARQEQRQDFAAELAKLGYPFARPRPARARRRGRRIDIAFAIEQGPRAYVERIDIHGNTRTRGYVIRREFDIAEGDAFNKGLIDRAERRLKNLDYFKTVKITTKPGSASDRVILDVELQEKAPAISTSPAAIRPPTAGSPKSNSATAISPAPASRSTPPLPTASTPAASMSRQPIPASSATALGRHRLFGQGDRHQPLSILRQ